MRMALTRRPSDRNNSTIQTEILRHLLQSNDRPVSGEDLALKLGVTRTAVWTHIQELRQIGYKIEAAPHVGYRLLGLTPLLCAEEIRARLKDGCCIGRQVLVYRETSSTNDVVDRLGRDGLPEGCVVFAEQQSNGRGRLGRGWFSPPYVGLWFSVLLRPAIRPAEASKLTILAVVSCVRALTRIIGRPLGVKWPNDIVADGRKLCGVLVEMKAELDRLLYAVLGIGLNVNQEVTDFPRELQNTATSLRMLTGQVFHRNEIAAALLEELDLTYTAFNEGQWAAIIEEWRAHAETLGKRICVQIASGCVEGVAEAIDEDGMLMLRTSAGRLIRLSSGIVTEEIDHGNRIERGWKRLGSSPGCG